MAAGGASCGEPNDLEGVWAARERIATHGRLVWPGWTDGPPVLIRSGEVDCLIAHPRPPEGLEVDAAGNGRRLAAFAMPLCRSDPCPVYRPVRAYRYALETEPGRRPSQLYGAVLDLGDG